MTMLENAEGTVRYEFFIRPIRRSNVDDTIVGYRYIISHHTKLVGGSTYTDRDNKEFKELRAKGLQVVKIRSFA